MPGAKPIELSTVNPFLHDFSISHESGADMVIRVIVTWELFAFCLSGGEMIRVPVVLNSFILVKRVIPSKNSIERILAMKNKKIFLAIFVLNTCLFFAIGAIAVEKSIKAEEGGAQLQAEKTLKLVKKALVGEGSEVVGDANQFFLISLDKNVGVMRNNSDEANKGITWIVSISHTTIEKDAETEAVEAIEAVAVLPEEFALNQNFPNPFNPTTTINFQLPDKNGSGTIHTVLKIYDILGRLVRTVVDEDLSPGFYVRQWNGLNDRGLRIGSGVYFYTLSAGDFREVKKMLVVK